MRRAFGAIIACLAVAAALTASASADNGVTRETHVFEGEMPIACTDQVGFFHLEYTSMIHAFVDGSGTAHLFFSAVADHIYGVGLDGTVYRQVGASSPSITIDPTGDPVVFHATVHIRLIAEGGGPTWVVNQAFLFVVTPSGQFTLRNPADSACL